MTLLVTENLTMSFGREVVLDGVDFSVELGEIKGIVGPNGTGKSTLLRLISGELQPSEGKIYFDDRDMTGKMGRVFNRSGISYLTQRPMCFHSLTVRENIRGAAQRGSLFSRQYAERVQDLVGLVGLVNKVDLVVDALSYGEMRALDLAMALASNPRLLLADEPTAGVSDDVGSEIVSLLKSLCKHEYSGELGLDGLIFVDHDKGNLFDLADKIGFLHQGKLTVEGTPESIQQYEVVAQYFSEHHFE